MEYECVGCGCTDHKACVVDGVPCHWLALDRVMGVGVCSCCPGSLEGFKNSELLDFSCETGIFYDCQIRTVSVEDCLPTEAQAELSIQQAQEKNNFRLKEYFLEYHNKEHGMAYDSDKVEKWLAAEQYILKNAYGATAIPDTAFVYVY